MLLDVLEFGQHVVLGEHPGLEVGEDAQAFGQLLLDAVGAELREGLGKVVVLVNLNDRELFVVEGFYFDEQ